MKKLFCLIAAAMMILSAAAAEIDLSAMTIEELEDLRTRIDVEIARRTVPAVGERVYQDQYGSLVFTRSEVRSLLGNRYLYLYFDWTNLGTGESSFLGWANYEFHQDGVNLYGAGDNTYTQVRPGTTIGISLYCTLRSDSDVEFSLGRFIGSFKSVWYTGTFSCR